jgi:hypothetical protein
MFASGVRSEKYENIHAIVHRKIKFEHPFGLQSNKTPIFPHSTLPKSTPKVPSYSNVMKHFKSNISKFFDPPKLDINMNNPFSSLLTKSIYVIPKKRVNEHTIACCRLSQYFLPISTFFCVAFAHFMSLYFPFFIKSWKFFLLISMEVRRKLAENEKSDPFVYVSCATYSLSCLITSKII